MLPPLAVRRATIAAPYLRVLQKAAEISGGITALAAALSVAPERLESWLTGDVVPPVDYYVAALQIVEGSKSKQ